MTILALDTGSNTGWACGTMAPDTFGTACFDASDRAGRWCAFEAWLADTIDAMDPTILAYESPIHRGNGSLALAGFAVITECIAHEHNLIVVPVNNAQIKKHAGVAGHDKPIEAALAKGWPVEDDHQADAAFLLDYIATGLAE